MKRALATSRDWLRTHAGGESRGRRIAWVAVAVVLVVVPVVVNLERASSYTASLDVFPRKVDGYPPVRDPAYYRAFLADPELADQMALNTGAERSEYEDASLRLAGDPPRLVLAVSAGTPARARDLTNALGPQLAGASRRQLARQAAKDADELRARLGESGLSGRARRRLRRELRTTEALRDDPPERAVLGNAASLPPIHGWADELADALPGAFHARPSPLWAGLAGLLVALLLWLVALLLLPPARRGSAAPPA